MQKIVFITQAYFKVPKDARLIHKDIRYINKGKNKAIYVYFVKQKLFRYSPSSVLLN